MSNSSSLRKGQERIIDLFKVEDVEVISGIVDVHFMDFHRAAIASGIKMVGTRHEVASVMVADAAARMTGRPQVAMAAFGPGVGNMVGGVVTANEENVPMIVLVSGRGFHTRSVVRNTRFQYWSQLDIFKHICKWAVVIQSIHQVDEIIHEAFRQARSGRPGPVYIEVPVEIMWEEAEFSPAPRPEEYRSVAPQAAPDALIDQAVAILASATCPVILAGQGIHMARAHGHLEKLCKIMQCPVVPSFGGRGALPETDPQTLMFGFAGANEACAKADVVLALGTSIGEPLLCGEPPRWGKQGKQTWIHVERDATRLHTNRFAELAIVGDLNAVLPQLSDALSQHEPFTQAPEVGAWRKAQDEWRQSVADNTHTDYPIHPGRMMLEAREAVPDDAVIVRDGGCTVIWDLTLFEQRSSDFLWTSHSGHLGCGLPYAIGAQLIAGNGRPVVVITGDGSLGFQFMEFETAVRENLPIVVIVNYDQHWGMELMDYYDGADSIEKCPGTRMALTRYDEMARAIGGHGEYVEKIAEVRPAIERALQSGKPAIVQIMTDVNINANTLSLPAVDEILSFYYLDGNQGYGHFEDLN